MMFNLALKVFFGKEKKDSRRYSVTFTSDANSCGISNILQGECVLDTSSTDKINQLIPSM